MEASALSHPVGLGRVSLAGPLLRLRSDDQLVALFRAGHDEAFGTIHDRYRARLFAYCRQMLGGSRGDAEDVLQDVFLRAYNSLRADRRDVALRAWLYRVAHNRCIDHLRRPTPAAEDIFDVNRGSDQERPEDAFERREDLRRLIADVRALPEQQRSALLMREMEGLSYNDLADALGVTVPAIKSLLVRARIGLVEAVEARDTACVEIRDDLDGAFARGVRVSGRARKHLKECGGCREYRVALRGVEKGLNGLAPSAGPLGLVAKLLGIGGAGSGGGAAVLGGGGGAAGAGVATVATGTTAATVGGSAVATKVVAVVAAAAVVGGGAATVQKVEHAVKKPAAHERVVDKAARLAAVPAGATLAEHAATARGAAATTSSSSASAAAAAAAEKRRALSHTGGLRPTHAGAGATATKLSTSATASAEAAPKLEETSGGLEAPAETSDTTAIDPGGSGTATSGAAQGATTGAGSTAASGTTSAEATGTTASTGTSTGTASGSGTSATGTSATSGTAGTTATSGSASSTPSGSVSQTPSGPIAQGASATPAG